MNATLLMQLSGVMLLSAVQSLLLMQPGVARGATGPYPSSALVESIEWHWETLRSAAPGSDLWPLTWAGDDNLYAAWGDGGGFGGTDQDGRVALGFGRIEGPPEAFHGVNINGGKAAENAATFGKRGKTGGMLSCDGILYAWINRQNGVWPDVDHGLAWSKDLAKSWENSSWVFPKGKGNLKPSIFLNCGKDYVDVPSQLVGFIYFYCFRQGNETEFYLGRAPRNELRQRQSFEFLSGFSGEKPLWSADPK